MWDALTLTAIATAILAIVTALAAGVAIFARGERRSHALEVLKVLLRDKSRGRDR